MVKRALILGGYGFAIALCLSTLVTGHASADDKKLKVLIVDGRNNHDWKATTPLLKKALESCGRFTVDVATAPPKGQDISTFRPAFADYDVVLSNYNDGDLWS